MRKTGAIPSQIIEQLIANDNIFAETPIPADNIQPASLDLRLGARAWEVQASFLPIPGEPIEIALHKYAAQTLDLAEPTVLELDKTYVAELEERFSLPPNVHAYTNNKSTTGRTNVWVRTLADGLPRFDKIPEGYKGKAYVMITPRSWPVKVMRGNTLNQARLLMGDSHLIDLELEILHRQFGLVFDPMAGRTRALIDNGLLLTVDLRQPVVGYEAIPCANPVDLTISEPQNGADYFRPISAENGEILLKKNGFYILSTKEYLRVPPDFAVEMAAYDIHSGEYRSHYAGFFDPGFGCGEDGSIKGTPAVLELDTHENVIFRDGQPICKMVFENLLKRPDKIYGQDLGSHYQNQRGPRLGRHFSGL